MSTSTDVRLTPGRRLTRGIKYSVVGPVDVTRGTLGLGLSGAASSAAWVGRKVRSNDAGAEGRRRRPLLYVLIGAVVLAGGAAAFSIVRRSMRPEPSTLPPSVAVVPKP